MTAPAPILRWGSLSEQPFRLLNAPRTFPPWSVPASPSVFRPTWLIASLNSSTSWQTAKSGESVNQLKKAAKAPASLPSGIARINALPSGPYQSEGVRNYPSLDPRWRLQPGTLCFPDQVPGQGYQPCAI